MELKQMFLAFRIKYFLVDPSDHDKRKDQDVNFM